MIQYHIGHAPCAQELLQVKHLRLALGASVDESNLLKAQECCFVKSVAVHANKAEVLGQAVANVSKDST